MDELTLKRRATKGAMQIEPILVVSTAHVTAAEAEALDTKQHSIRPTFTRDEGWLFSMSDFDNPETGDFVPVSDSMALVVKRARDLGCDWIMFDMDAGIIEDIPSHEW